MPAAAAAPKGDIPADSFANRLVLARMHAGNLPIREAADMCGIGRGSWTGWERGARPHDLLDAVGRISETLNIDHDWLLFGGPLRPVTSSRNRPSRRERHSDTLRYQRPPVRPSIDRPKRGGQSAPTRPGVRRPKRIDLPPSATITQPCATAMGAAA